MQRNTPSIRHLFPEYPCDGIYFAENLPSAGDEIKMCKLSPDNLVKKFPDMKEWSETISVDVSEKIQSLELKNYFIINWNELQSILYCAAINLSKLVLCYMNEKVGYGVFAREDIAEDSTISFYAGQIRYHGAYNKSLANNPYIYLACDGELMISVDAKERGNISRFLQHLPCTASCKKDETQHYLSDYDFIVPLKANQVATANLTLSYWGYNDAPLIVFKTSRAIKKGEQLGYSYGWDYWEYSQNSPYLFNRAGQLIPLSLYQPKEVLIKISLESSNYNYTSVTIKSTSEQFKKFFANSENTYKAQLSDNTQVFLDSLDYLAVADEMPHALILNFPRPSRVVYPNGTSKVYPSLWLNTFFVKHWENARDYSEEKFKKHSGRPIR